MNGRRLDRTGIIGSMLALKDRMSITLYGSYHPPSEMRFLERQRDFLRDGGYSGARLVVDDPTAGADPLTVSKRHLLHSDVNFMSFTKFGMRHGVVRELAYVAEDPDMESKVADCVVFDEVGGGKSSIPDLSKSDINNRRIEMHRFKDVKSLCALLLDRADLFVIEKAEELRTRPFA